MRRDVATGKAILRDLGDGLVLRRATVADTEALAAFDADVLRDPGAEEPDQTVVAWTRDLMTRPHPTFDVGDFTVVEDTNTGAIVSSLNLIAQTWSYGGIEFGVGRPELVSTHPDYRRRGLVRAQFEVIHEWSAERGQKLQAITGIPWFYRQFGYEMGLTLGGGRIGYPSRVPKLEDGQSEPYRVRPAVESDLPFIADVYRQAIKRSLVACVRDEAMWRYELCGKSQKNGNRWELRVVETADGGPVGFVAHPWRLWRQALGITVYELKPGISWLTVTPSVLRYLRATGEAYAAQEQKGELEAFALWLGPEHPAYEVAGDWVPHARKPYAWYVRVPDVPDFLRHVAPVLEQRLADSALVGHTGELKISFYRDGLRLAFEDGRLIEAGPWMPTHGDRGGAAFPNLTFLQLLFGYRSLEELDYAFADCWTASEEAWALLDALFPKQVSYVWPVA